MNHKKQLTIAICLTLISSLMYAMMIAYTKILQQNLSSNLIILFRYGISFFIFVPYLFIKKKESTKTSMPIKHFFRSIFGFLGLITTIIATRYIPVPDAVLLSNTYPLFLPILVFLHEKRKLHYLVLISLFLGFIGIALILQPTNINLDIWSLLALSSGLFTALTMTFVKELSKTETISQINYQFLFYSFIFAIALYLFDAKLPTIKDIPHLITIGVIGTIYQQTFLWALKFAHTIIVAPLFYSSIIFGAIIEWILVGSKPDVPSMIGFIMVFLASTLIVKTMQRKESSNSIKE
jgi:drug/metabolite transporter (DMT)-like permease